MDLVVGTTQAGWSISDVLLIAPVSGVMRKLKTAAEKLLKKEVREGEATGADRNLFTSNLEADGLPRQTRFRVPPVCTEIWVCSGERISKIGQLIEWKRHVSDESQSANFCICSEFSNKSQWAWPAGGGGLLLWGGFSLHRSVVICKVVSNPPRIK